MQSVSITDASIHNEEHEIPLFTIYTCLNDSHCHDDPIPVHM